MSPVRKEPVFPVRSLDEVIREHIVYALRGFEGNMMAAARGLGIGRSTLYRYLEKYHKRNLGEEK